MRSLRKNSFTDFTRSKASSVRNVGLRHVVGLVVTAVIFGVFATQPVAAQGEPCTQCGPGEHWVDICSAGYDSIANQGAVVGIDLDLDCEVDVNLILWPCAAPNDLLVISRSDPRDDSQNFPGLRPVDGHLDVIDTEIISMCLTGGGVTLKAGLGQGGVISPSLGAVAEKPSNSLLAESFFDVFFEVDLGGGMFVYNHDSLRLEANINCVPPIATYIHPTGCLPLYTAPEGGAHVANLVTAQHMVNLPVGACCGPDSTGGCVDGLTWEECKARNGRYMGNGTTCAGVAEDCPTLTQWGLIILVALIVFSTWVVLILSCIHRDIDNPFKPCNFVHPFCIVFQG